MRYRPMPGIPDVTVSAWRGELGEETDPLAYVGHLVLVFRALRCALHPTGTLWLNLGDSFARGRTGRADEDAPNLARRQAAWGIGAQAKATGKRKGRERPAAEGLDPKQLVLAPARVFLALQADGWIMRADNVWDKPNKRPDGAFDRPTLSHEYVGLLARQPSYFYDVSAVAVTAARRRLDRDGPTTRNGRSVWAIATEPYKGAHDAPFPRALVRPCILASTPEGGVCAACGTPAPPAHGRLRGYKGCACRGQTERRPVVVLDPFAGSGTVGEVAGSLHRDAILVDASAANEVLCRARAEKTGSAFRVIRFE
jgi:DNA modification methylase